MYVTCREESKTIRSAPEMKWVWDSIHSPQFPFCFIDWKTELCGHCDSNCAHCFSGEIFTLWMKFGGTALQKDDCNGFVLFKTVQWVYLSKYVLLYQPRQLVCLCFNFSCHDMPTTLLRNGLAPRYSVLMHLMHLPWAKQRQSSADEILGVPGAETLARLNK